MEDKDLTKCRCWFCGGDMFWQCDFSFDDYGLEGEGIIATLLCSNCGATADFYTAIQD